MDFEKLVSDLIKRAQKDGKVFESRKIEFKQNYALRSTDGKINKAVQAEMIKDVMSLANSLPDPEFETGMLILGVATNGDIIENYTLLVSDFSELPHLINGVLERPITFSYREYEIMGKKVGAIIIPRSTGTPHIVKNSLSENGVMYLRPGECWTRVDGGKSIAMASDFDELYEYLGGINKFQGAKNRKELTLDVKKKKTFKQANKVEEVLNIDNDLLNERIKKLLR